MASVRRGASPPIPWTQIGNTTKAVTKGYAIGSSHLAAVFLPNMRMIEGAGASTFDLSNPSVLVGLFLGGMLPFIFGASCESGAGATAGMVVEEVRRQFRTIEGIMKRVRQAGHMGPAWIL